MSAATLPLPPQAAYTSEPIYRLSVDQYHDLIERGTLTADDPVELIEGMLVYKMPKYPPHTIATGTLGDLIGQFLPAGYHLRNQEPVTLDDGEPEPDMVIARGERRGYSAHHPRPADILLLVEVAESTLERDRGIKLRSYARAGIVCYWIVNLVDGQIEVFSDPAPAPEPPRFKVWDVFKSGDAASIAIAGKIVGQIQVSDLLPMVE